ncbi:cobalt-precorrin-6A reductase [Aquihabitans daechungensis]|uniref:cobalt-precorrin-6A reductase n=1 Tax=Aquihabitans daechungensis TaxID=1052257 RepID=UPI003BA2FA83
MTTPRVLLLAGTTEATVLATALGEQPPGSVDLTVSFAGRTSAPSAPFGYVRVGGFGGVDGLVAYLAEHHTDAVVDALHPFAAIMPFHASDACTRTGTPRLKLVRPPWRPVAGDDWIAAPSITGAAAAVHHRAPRRVLLTIGRQELDPFRSLVGSAFIVRTIEPVELDGEWDARLLLARGPFTVEEEISLLEREGIDLIVSKNAGGRATEAKLTATRSLGIPVVMVDRPPVPEGLQVATVPEALAWLAALD